MKERNLIVLALLILSISVGDSSKASAVNDTDSVGPMMLAPSEIGSSNNEGYTVASRFRKDEVNKKIEIIARVARDGDLSNRAAVEYLSAFQTFGLDPGQSSERKSYTYGYWLFGDPTSWDAADIPFHGPSVRVTSVSGLTEFDAEAYAKQIRVVSKTLDEVFSKAWEHRNEILEFVAQVGGLSFSSSVERIEDDLVKYTYKIKNTAERTAYFRWASAITDKTPSGFSGSVEPGSDRVHTAYAKGPLAGNFDIVTHNFSTDKYLYQFAILGEQEKLDARLIELASQREKSPSILEFNEISIAPAFVSTQWLRR